MKIPEEKLTNVTSKLLSSSIEQLSLESDFQVSNNGTTGVLTLKMSLFSWENWEPQDYDNFESYENDKKEFQIEFDEILTNVTKILGSPVKKGKKANFDKETLQTNGWLLVYYHYAFWKVDGKIIVLQQGERKSDGAAEISIWVLPNKNMDSLPSFPIKG